MLEPMNVFISGSWEDGTSVLRSRIVADAWVQPSSGCSNDTEGIDFKVV